MKKNFIYATLSAIALVGAVSLSACSSSEDAVDVNPTFDGKAVKTQFTISLPFNNTKTRQSSSVVQQAENITSFRGMQDIVLIPFQSATDRATRLGSNITLGAGSLAKPIASASANALNGIPAAGLLPESKAVLFNDVTIPVGTSGFLFYGKAIGTDGYEDGYLTTTGLEGEPPAISFTPTPIQPTLVTTKGVALANYVKSIAAAAPTSGDAAWWKCATTANSTETWYNAGLGELYKSFISMKAGASSYVLAAIQDLYYSVRNNTDDISKAIKKAIYDDTETHTYVSSVDGDGKLTFKSTITGYPEDNNYMPDGAAALTWSISADQAASAKGPSVPTAVTDEASITYGGMNLIRMSTIAYPASLYYFVDSKIKTSNTSRTNDYDGDKDPDTEGTQQRNWTEILATYNSGTSVSSATRSVAIEDEIRYAVGRLDVNVSALGTEKHYDRKGVEVTFPTGAAADDQCFPLTGVLIGGQKAVGYNFEQIPSTNTDLYTGTEYTIYDKTINTESPSTSSNVSAGTAAGPTYTLALETAAQEEVYVALEFVNNANDFQGVDGVVKHGCKFYMIAKLDPKNDVANAVSGVSNTDNKVFKQHYKTIANFSIGKGAPDDNGDGVADTGNFGGFANAYVTIPDLRTPQLELGLSVNLKWEDGITFTVEF